MDINLYLSNPFQKEEEIMEVDEFTFWQVYLRQLQCIKEDRSKRKKLFQNKEIDVLAYVLAGNPSITYFRQPYITELANFIERDENYINQMRISLVNKGLLVADDIRGEWFLSKNLSQLQKYVRHRLNSNSIVNFTFKLNVARNN